MGAWLDGWVGGVLAASITIVATFWWDMRSRRMARLDDAVAALSAAAWDFGTATGQMHSGLRPSDQELNAGFRALVLALFEVQAHAFRSRLGPGRGLAVTLNAFTDDLARRTLGAANKHDWLEMETVCAAVQLACYDWMQKPRSYWRGSDRSRDFLGRLEGSALARRSGRAVSWRRGVPVTKEHNYARSMVRTLQLIVACVATLALVALVWLLWTTPRTNWDLVPTAAGGAIVASCVAGLIALTVSETVTQRRAREVETVLRNHREQVYEGLIQHMVGIFSGSSPAGRESEVRAAAAVWANGEVIDKLAAWNNRTAEIMKKSGGAVSLAERPQLQEQLAELVVAVRADLADLQSARGEPSKERIARMIFNDYGSSNSATPPESS